MIAVEQLAHRLHGAVRDVMIPADVCHCVPSALPVTNVAEIMSENNQRHLIVLREDRRILGVVSQRDILKQLLQTASRRERGTETEADGGPVGEIVTREAVTISADIALVKAGLVLATNKIGCLPVVDEDKRFLGCVTVAQILRISVPGSPRCIDTEFEFYIPNSSIRSLTPAFIRRSNSELVVPLHRLGHHHEGRDYALLGFDAPTGRILLKLIDQPTEGARRVTLKGDHLVVPAADFVAHFGIRNHGSALDVSAVDETGRFVLTPRTGG
jgi:CBS-domain-containing membrane protein